MPLVLAVEPDPKQAAVLRRVLKLYLDAEVVIAESRDAAVAAIGARVPDVILLTALMSPRDEEELVSHLKALDGADHLQTYTIPLLAQPARSEKEGGGGLFGKLRRKKEPEPIAGCDPQMFAEEVRAFLARAAEMKAQTAPLEMLDRAPTVVDDGPSLAEIERAKILERQQVEDEQRRQAVEQARALAEAERARLEAERQRVEEERRVADEERRRNEEEQLRADEARQRTEAERLRADAEQAALADERRRLAAEQAAIAEQRRAESERAAAEQRKRDEAERARRAAEDAAARERERVARERERVEAEAQRAREAAQQRDEAERQSLEAQRQRLDAERKRRVAEEAAAEAELQRMAADRQRIEAEQQRAELERRRQEAERERLEAEREARDAERERVEAELEQLAAEEAAERERLQVEREAALAAAAEAAAEDARRRAEAEKKETESRRRSRPRAVAKPARAAKATRPPAPIEAQPADPFADFREFVSEEQPTAFRHMPLARWARVEDRVTTVTRRTGVSLRPAASTTPDSELHQMMASLSVPVHVAAIAYATGCRIRRVRVAPLPENATESGGPTVILSKRALDELRDGR